MIPPREHSFFFEIIQMSLIYGVFSLDNNKFSYMEICQSLKQLEGRHKRMKVMANFL